MGLRGKKVLATAVSAALAASLCALPGTAFAAGGLSGSVGDGTNWKVPTSQEKNIVVVGQGENQVPYKVITTWANAWALSGPDYLGVSNSGTLNQQGGGAGSTALANAQNDTLLGIWASSANEVPNAYNWNYFYNLALKESGGELVDTAAIDVQNGANAGFDSESGVWAAFKYRPEIIWTSNSLSAVNAEKYSALIKGGQYITGTGAKWNVENVTVDENGNVTDGNTGDNAATVAEDASAYALYNDNNYKPYIMSAKNSTALTFTDSFYELADNAEKVIADTAAYADTYAKDGDALTVTKNSEVGDNGDVVVASADGTDIWKVTKKTTADARTGRTSTSYALDTSNVTWKTMNYLPRTTRYVASAEDPMTARECALAIEKVTRGAVYYTLSQINDGIVPMKKVAFLTGDPKNGTATVVKYDFVDQIGAGQTGGKTGVASLVVDQLTGTNGRDGASAAGSGEAAACTIYDVTADDLAGCDYVVDANGSMTANQLQSWVAKNVSSAALKTRALNTVQYLTNSPAIMNGHNFTAEKLIWGAFNIDFFYPELFPNMELTTWWYDNVYHLKANSVKTAMQWGLANASLPAETDLASLGKGYSTADLDSKFKAGYDYYQSIKDTAPYNSDAWATLAPSATFDKWAAAEPSFNGTISFTGTKTYNKVASDAAFQLDAKASIANTALTYASSNSSVATVDANGKVTIKGTGKATITVTATKARYDSASMSIEVNVASKAQPMTVKAKTLKAKAGKSYKVNKYLTVSKAQGKLTYKKTSGNKKITVASNGKISVKKGLKKGTYKVKVKVSAAGNASYAAGNKTVTVRVKVK